MRQKHGNDKNLGSQNLYIALHLIRFGSTTLMQWWIMENVPQENSLNGRLFNHAFCYQMVKRKAEFPMHKHIAYSKMGFK